MSLKRTYHKFIKLSCFGEKICSCYHLGKRDETVVFCRKDQFVLPSGKARRKFVREVSGLMSEWLHDSPLKDIAFNSFKVEAIII